MSKMSGGVVLAFWMVLSIHFARRVAADSGWLAVGTIVAAVGLALAVYAHWRNQDRRQLAKGAKD